MSSEEMEIDAKLLDLTDIYNTFDEADDDELKEVIDALKEFNVTDTEEIYEYFVQYAPMDEKRFLSLIMD